jgi:hypothetical protein
MRGFRFNDRRFKVAVRADPEFLSASIHDLHFLIGCGLLALVTFKRILSQTHNSYSPFYAKNLVGRRRASWIMTR